MIAIVHRRGLPFAPHRPEDSKERPGFGAGLRSRRPTARFAAARRIGAVAILGPVFLLPIIEAAIPTDSAAADWPMWRYDAGRTASSPERLPDRLRLKWSLKFPRRVPAWDEPLNRDLMPYDKALEPVVMGGLVFVAFNDSDKIVAFDLDSGREKWRAYTDGPVRLPPAGWDGRLYVASDDGFLRCLDADNGSLMWKVRPAPSGRMVLGNRRMISAWPARGGPVAVDGRVYFAAGIWPFMGVFVSCLDAKSGAEIWENSALGEMYILQPHSAPSFGGLAPQGALAVCGDSLLVPGGRSVPASLDIRDGSLRYYHLSSYDKIGGSFVCAAGKRFFSHKRRKETICFELQSGRAAGRIAGPQPVIQEDGCFFSGTSVKYVRFDNPGEAVWEIDADATGDLVRAGDRLYAGGKGTIAAVEIAGRSAPRIAWEIKTGGTVERLVAASGRLIAVTLEGDVFCYGDASGGGSAADVAGIRTEAGGREGSAGGLPEASEDQKAYAAEALKAYGGSGSGFCLAAGLSSGGLIAELVRRSGLYVIATDPDQAKVADLRRRFDDAGLYGTRVHLFAGDLASLEFPPYFAELLVSEDFARSGIRADKASISRAFDLLRPYGGTACLKTGADPGLTDAAREAGLPGAEVLKAGEGLTMLRRAGALPGSAPWTHQYGDAANSLKSDDSLVRPPLGILWFGGNSHEDVLPRHGHGPPPQIIGGRLFIQGLDSLSARDVYTGRVLWKTRLDRLGTFGIYHDETHHDGHLELDYNQQHIPGANARGTNFVAAEDSLYVVQGAECTVLDPATGRKKDGFRLLRPDGSPASSWGYIGLSGDLLIGGADFAEFTEKAKEADPRLTYRFPKEIYDRVASKGLTAMDRKTGKKLWGIKARYAFLHNGIAIGGGRLYCLDRIPPFAHNALAAASTAPPADTYSMLALDLKTGRTLWRNSANIFGSWLAYSSKHDVLVQAARPSRDMIEGEYGARVIAYRAADGTVLWDKEIRYWTPLILHGDRIVTSSEMFGLLDGRPATRRDPLTGIECPWTYRKGYGCDYPIASEHLLTFRSGAAGFCDLARDTGFGNFGGFKSGCTSNLIAADGLLNAPDYTRTCSCSYQNQTSLAMVHMPGIETWTAYECVGSEGPIRRLGLNLGAPGFRIADDGTPWIPYPDEKRVGPCVEIEREPADVRWFRRHPSRVSGESPAWVAASGGIGIRKVEVFLDTRDVGTLGRSIAVASKSDDAHEDAKEGMGIANGTVLELASPGGSKIVGIRFGDVRVARGSKVKRAHVQFSAARYGGGAARITIAGEAADDASPFKPRKKEISGRKKTAASVTWEPPDWTDEDYRGPAQRTPNLASILQEIFDRPGWKPGNAIALIIRGEGRRAAFSMDGDKDGAPVLVLECAAPDEDGRGKPARTFAVRLHFAEPDAAAPGERVFSIAIQGKEVLSGMDVAKEAGGRMRSIVREFGGIRASDSLAVEMRPFKGLPVLCGMEIIER